MRRPYTAERFRRTVDRLRERLDDPAITTDVIVGFPGETDADFEETLAMVRQAQFSKIHTFPFSPREGTDAATLPDPVHGLVVQERKKLLFAAEQQHRDASLNRRLGTLVEVVVERADDRSVLGTDERYHRTSLPPDLGIRPGELVRAQVESVEDGRLIASPVDARSASAGERVSA